MSWEAINAITGLVGVVAIVVSLIYVSAEIRQNTKVARAATRQAISAASGNLASDLMDNPDMAEIFVKHMNGEELDAVEKLRLQARCYRDMQHWENIHYQFEEGFISAEQWAGFRKNLRSLLAIEIYRDYWKIEATHYSDTFQEEVWSLFEEAKSGADIVPLEEQFRSKRPTSSVPPPQIPDED